jgi:hypothetical protein
MVLAFIYSKRATSPRPHPLTQFTFYHSQNKLIKSWTPKERNNLREKWVNARVILKWTLSELRIRVWKWLNWLLWAIMSLPIPLKAWNWLTRSALLYRLRSRELVSYRYINILNERLKKGHEATTSLPSELFHCHPMFSVNRSWDTSIWPCMKKS